MQQYTEVLQETDSKEEQDVEEVISTSQIKEMLGMWERRSESIKKKQPEKVATGRAAVLYDDTCLTHFCNILRCRIKQTLDGFLKREADKSEGSAAEKPNISEDDYVFLNDKRQ